MTHIERLEKRIQAIDQDLLSGNWSASAQLQLMQVSAQLETALALARLVNNPY